MTIKDAIQFGIKNKVDSFNSKELLEFILKVDKNYIITNNDCELDDQQEKEYLVYLGQLINGKPLQYITKKQYFMGEEFYVDENVLIPQPDTEVLVEQTLKVIEDNINEKKDTIKILDLCTGSGAIAISILKQLQKIRQLKKNNSAEFEIEMYASDISNQALEVAKRNEIRILKENRIKFIQSNMFDKIKIKDFDIIVSNPPYIKTEEIKLLSKDVQNEPKIALDGGEDGIKFYNIINENIKEYLKENGFLLMEIGYDQKEKVQKIFKNSECIKDYSGNDRVIIWRKV